MSRSFPSVAPPHTPPERAHLGSRPRRDAGARCRPSAILDRAHRALGPTAAAPLLVLLSLIALPASAHKASTQKSEVCVSQLRVETVVSELFAGSDDVADLLMRYQRPNQALQEILFGSYDFRATGVGNQVIGFNEVLALPPSAQNDFRAALRAEEPLFVDLVWRGLTFNQPDVFETHQTELLRCDIVFFGTTELVLPSDADLDRVELIRTTLSSDNPPVAVDVGSDDAGPCDEGFDFSFIDPGAPSVGDYTVVTFPDAGSQFVDLVLCDGFQGPVTLFIEERLGGLTTLPSVIVQPDEMTVRRAGPVLRPDETLLFGNPLYEFNAVPPVGGFITSSGHATLVDVVGDGPGRRDVIIEEQILIQVPDDRDYASLHMLDNLFNRRLRLRGEFNVWGRTQDPVDTWSTWRADSSAQLGIDFDVQADGLPIPAASVNRSNRSSFLVHDAPDVRAFVLSRHELNAPFDSFPLGPGDGPAAIESLGDDRWISAHSVGGRIDLTTFDPGGILHQTSFPKPFPDFQLQPIGNRGDRFALVGYEVVTDPSDFFYFHARVDGQVQQQHEVGFPNGVASVGFAGNEHYLADLKFRDPSFSLPGDRAVEAAEGEVLEAVIHDWQGHFVETLEIATDVSDPEAFLTDENELVVAYRRPTGIYATAFKLPDQSSQCTPDEHTLCLGRYRVQGMWADQEGNRSRADVFPLTSDTGYFTFLDPSNPEIFFKTVEDGCLFPGGDPHTWVFAGGLTSLWSEWTIEDTVTGISKTYVNPGGKPYLAIRDVQALGNCSSVTSSSVAPVPRSAATERPLDPVLLPEAETFENCTETDQAACLTDGRFRVTVDYRVAGQQAAPGQMVRITGDGAYAWFFSPENVEVFVKILDACALTDSFWLFAAGLTDVEVTIRVTDGDTGQEETYLKPLGEDFAPILRFNDFAACSP